jgi:hypothetical protein
VTPPATGSRNDNPASDSITIEVGTGGGGAGVEWSPDEPANSIRCDGITSPAPGTTVRVLPGESVSCGANPGSDTDKRTDHGSSPETVSYHPDEIRYLWSASGGSFAGPVNGQGATWTAPDQAGTFQIRVKVYDVASIPQGEGGDRDDQDKEFTASVEVVDPFDMHVDWRPDATTASPQWAAVTGGEIGGVAYVHLRFFDRPGYSPRLQRLEILENAPHGVPLLASPGDFGPGDGSACGDPGDNGEPRVHYRYLWNTRLGHSYDHTITARVAYTVNGANRTRTKTLPITPRNLRIDAELPANPTPLIWDPAAGATVALQAKVSSAKKIRCYARCTILSESGVALATLQATETTGLESIYATPGGTAVKVVWNGLANLQPQPKGIYLFKWDAGLDPACTEDHSTDKSETLTVVPRETVLQGSQLNGDEAVTTNSKRVYARYVLQDSQNANQNAGEAKVTLYSPTFSDLGSGGGNTLVSSPGPTERVNDSEPKSIPVDSWLPYRHVISAKDSFTVTNKFHLQRWALQRVLQQQFPLALNYQFKNYPVSRPLDPVGTTPYGRMAAERQQGPLKDGRTGYLAQCFTNQDVNHFVQQLPTATIVHTFGHGGGNDYWRLTFYATFWNGSSWSLLSETTPPQHQVPPGMPWVKMRSLPAGAFSKVRLAVWVGCRTAMTERETQPGDPPLGRWGSPASGAVALGAECSVGFYKVIKSNTRKPNGEVEKPGAEQWDELFWKNMAEGATVEAACRAAALEARMDTSLASYKIFGNRNLKLHPATAR